MMLQQTLIVVFILLLVEGLDNERRIKQKERELRNVIKLGPSTPVSQVKNWLSINQNGTTIKVPAMLYGTAYKRHSTADVVERALRAGFFGIDTATAEGSRYNDSGVGEALRRVVKSTQRNQLFLQLKIHHVTHKDENQGDATTRVLRSFRRALSNLGVDYIDALMLRGPSREALRTGTLSQADIDAWATMHELLQAGLVRLLGVANFSPRLIDQLRDLSGLAPPAFLQAKCDADSGWARLLREYCKANNMLFQAPSLVTGNRAVATRGRPVYKIAFKRKVSSERIILRFALQLGIIPVVGPSSTRHIHDDFDAFNMPDLSHRDLAAIEQEAIMTTQRKARLYLNAHSTLSSDTDAAEDIKDGDDQNNNNIFLRGGGQGDDDDNQKVKKMKKKKKKKRPKKNKDDDVHLKKKEDEGKIIERKSRSSSSRSF
mmetsp:Transcript_1433/g.2085  ORF Transcript_1433/g.2085 Transcript_1433/m.2085 type:complete len:431 (+) Transcript_1433:79-1371(+)